MPIREADARAWLRRRGLIRDLDGSAVVLWGDVIAALDADAAPAAPVTRLGPL